MSNLLKKALDRESDRKFWAECLPMLALSLAPMLIGATFGAFFFYPVALLRIAVATIAVLSIALLIAYKRSKAVRTVLDFMRTPQRVAELKHILCLSVPIILVSFMAGFGLAIGLQVEFSLPGALVGAITGILSGFYVATFWMAQRPC